ncbi:hypothetical protein HK102_001448, partial [Quaeritorhiza haematococci]
WRQVLDEPLLYTGTQDSVVISISASDDTIRTRFWDTNTGFFIWEHQREVSSSNVNVGSEADTVFLPAGNVVTLTPGGVVTRLNIPEGVAVWEVDASVEGDAGIRYASIATSSAEVFLIGHSSSSSSLVVTTLDLATGSIKSSCTAVPDSKNVATDAASPYFVVKTWQHVWLVWNEKENARAYPLGSASEKKPKSAVDLRDILGLDKQVSLSAVSLSPAGNSPVSYFVVKTSSGNSVVLGLEGNDNGAAQLVKKHEFSKKSGSLFSINSVGEESFVSQLRSTDEGVDVDLVNVSTGSEVASVSVPHRGHETGPISEIHLDLTTTKSSDTPPTLRIFALTTDGSIHMLRENEVSWSRDEYLTRLSPSISSSAGPASGASSGSSVVFVDLPEKGFLSQDHDELDESPEQTEGLGPLERYARRVRTHLNKAQNALAKFYTKLDASLKSGTLPNFILESLPFFSSRSSGSSSPSLKNGVLYKDRFGLRKLIVVASSTGRVSALETEGGQVVWSRFFGSGGDASFDESVSWMQVEVVRPAFVKFPPVVVLVGKKGGDDGVVVLRRLNAITGEDYEGAGDGVPASVDVAVQGGVKLVVKVPVVEDKEKMSVLVLVDSEAKVHIYPDTPAAQKAFSQFAPKFRFYLVESDDAMRGYAIVGDGEEASKGVVYETRPVWNLRFPDGERIVKVAERPKDEKVASLGRVLGNRSVLYKYLNPNLVALTTLRVTYPSSASTDSDNTDATSGSTTKKTKASATTNGQMFTSTVTLYLVDVVTGVVQYHATYPGAGPIAVPYSSPSATTTTGKLPSKGIHLLQRDNWVVFTFYNHGPDAVEEIPDPSSTLYGTAPSSTSTSSAEGGEAAEEDLKSKRKRRKKVQARKQTPGGGVPVVPDVKSVEVVVLEVYESTKPNARMESPTYSSFESKRPHVITQSFTFPFPVEALGVTTTGSGITTREILFALASDQLLGVNKRVLDPRRPAPNAVTADDKEEGLIPYKGIIDFNQKDVASYSLEVSKIRRIISSPSTLESTSLVLSYGDLDMFFARRSPSKTFDLLSEDFNRVGLVATVVVLVVGIQVAKWTVQKRRLKDLWK